MEDPQSNIVVIGAGVGGLATAMLLSGNGARVTVVEAADAPGGKMRTLPSAAGPIDAGPTVLTLRPVFEELFASAGSRLEDHVTLHREPCLARHFWPDGTCLDLYDDPSESAAEVRAVFGTRVEAEFLRFSANARALFEAFDAPLMRAPDPAPIKLAVAMASRPRLLAKMGAFRSMARQLASEFSEPKLRQLFGRYATYVGGSPDESPAVLRLIAHAEAAGVWRIAGGMGALARAMAKVAEANGTVFRYGQVADRLEIQSGRIVAVHLAAGGRIPASRAVFNGDPRALLEGKLGAAALEAVPRKAVEPRSLSANVWAFAARARGAALRHHNVFFGDDPRLEFDPISAGFPPEDPTLYVCAQDRGTGETPPETERFEIIMNAPPLPGGKPEDIALCRTRTFPVLARRGLRFSPEPPDAALTTPWGFNALFPASQGSLYGRSPHGQMAAFARPRARTSLPGLYLAGGGAHPGAGLPMAALSGRHAAEAILTDLASTSASRQTATRGGISTGSPIVAPARSRSSPS
ncbi:MAG: 1-hydroxycarotenoid 3,4-desaturase CrtD [Pseudomonadota bacterium]